MGMIGHTQGHWGTKTEQIMQHIPPQLVRNPCHFLDVYPSMKGTASSSHHNKPDNFRNKSNNDSSQLAALPLSQASCAPSSFHRLAFRIYTYLIAFHIAF